MTRLSGRWALPLGVLLALTAAAVLTLRASPVRHACAPNEVLLDPTAFTPPLAVVEEGFRSTRIERGRLAAIWTSDEGYRYPVAIVRTYGLPDLLLHPPTALPGQNEADDVRLETLETPSGPLPVHYAYEHRGREVRVTAYLLGYRNEAVASPIWTRFREAPSAAIGGTWPITVFATAARGHRSEIEARRADLDRWLVQAWSQYLRVCPGE